MIWFKPEDRMAALALTLLFLFIMAASVMLFALDMSTDTVFEHEFPCFEDEVLYPVDEDGNLAVPEGTLTCVNIEELTR